MIGGRFDPGLVAFRRDDGVPVGTGFLAADRYILTCTHVVHLALGNAISSEPLDEGVELDVDFVALGNAKVRSKVLKSGQLGTASEDLTVLEIGAELPPNARSIPLGAATDPSAAQFCCFGFPQGWERSGQFAYGVIRDTLPDGHLQMEGTESPGARVAPGYSGSPVLLLSDGIAIGVLSESDVDKETKIALAIPFSKEGLLGLQVPIQRVDLTPSQRYAGLLRVALDTGTYALPEPMLDVPCRIIDPAAGPAEATELLMAQLDDSPRISLHAAAGGGKSGIVARLAREALNRNDLPVVLDLKGWTLSMSHRIVAAAAGPADRMDALLKATITDLDFDAYESLRHDERILLIADGLNEVSGDEALRAIIETLDDAVRAAPTRVRTLTTDRGRIGAIADLGKWAHSELDPLTAENVKDGIDAQFGRGKFDALSTASQLLITSPYFFHQAITLRKPDLGTRFDALRAFFEDAGLSNDDDVVALGEFFYHALEKLQSYSLPSHYLEDELGEPLRGVLMNTGVVVERDGYQQVDHQLKQDFLTSTYLARKTELWNSDGFDIVTFEGQSRDVLGLALSQLGTESADQFLATVYDWSYSAALECLRMAGREGGGGVSQEMRTFLLATTTERLWDPVERSRQRTRRLLKEQGDEAESYLACEDGGLIKLIELVANVDSSVPWFVDWRLTFGVVVGPVDEGAVQRLNDPDGRIGWTMANVLRRFKLDPAAQLQIRTIFRAFEAADVPNGATIRWRCVHALGGSVDEESWTLLLRALVDGNKWVSYGAVRALIEVASQSDSSSRERILQGILEQLAELGPRVIDELGFCVFIDNAPEAWNEDVSPLLDSVLQSRGSEAERERWEERIAEFEVYSGGKPN